VARRLLLGLDLGGGGVRSLLLDCDTGARSIATRSWVFPSAPDTFGLGSDLDLDAMWNAIGETCRDSLERCDGRGDEVVGVGVSALRFGNVILDRTGRALFAVPNRDARGAAESFQLGASDGEGVLADTGLWPMPIHASIRCMWLKNQRPEVLEAADCLLSVGDWVNFRLCGTRITDLSQAGCTGLFDLNTSEWSWDRIDALGFPRKMFGEVALSGTKLGELTADAASHLGLREGIPIGLGGADTQCGLLGAGVIRPGQVASIAGTTAPVQAVTEAASIDPRGRLWSGHHVVPGRYILESNGGPMGESLTWISRLLYPDSPAPEATFFEEAALSDVGAAGLLSTLGAEVMNARAPSMPVGQITLTHMTSADDKAPRRHMVRAIVEGYACAVRANLEQLIEITDATYPVLVLSGGMSRSDVFAQILSDVTGAEVRLSEVAEATAMGAAFHGGVAAGVYADIEEAVDRRVRSRAVLTPTAETVDASRELYESWCRLRDAGAETTAPAAAAHVTPWVLKMQS
jgi:sugar (pentulose or hexulose) kinase